MKCETTDLVKLPCGKEATHIVSGYGVITHPCCINCANRWKAIRDHLNPAIRVVPIPSEE